MSNPPESIRPQCLVCGAGLNDKGLSRYLCGREARPRGVPQDPPAPWCLLSRIRQLEDRLASLELDIRGEAQRRGETHEAEKATGHEPIRTR